MLVRKGSKDGVSPISAFSKEKFNFYSFCYCPDILFTLRTANFHTKKKNTRKPA